MGIRPNLDGPIRGPLLSNRGVHATGMAIKLPHTHTCAVVLQNVVEEHAYEKDFSAVYCEV